MNVYELVDALGGEIVRGRARWRDGATYVLLGKLNGDEMVMTEEGRRLAAELTAPPSDVESPAEAAPRRRRKLLDDAEFGI